MTTMIYYAGDFPNIRQLKRILSSSGFERFDFRNQIGVQTSRHLCFVVKFFDFKFNENHWKSLRRN